MDWKFERSNNGSDQQKVIFYLNNFTICVMMKLKYSKNDDDFKKSNRKKVLTKWVDVEIKKITDFNRWRGKKLSETIK